MNQIHNQPNTWRKYQKRLKREAWREYLLKRMPRLGVYGMGAFFFLVSILYSGPWLLANLTQGPQPERKEKPRQSVLRDQEHQGWSRNDLVHFLEDLDLDLQQEKGLSVTKDGKRFLVETSIDQSLQAYTSRLLERSLTHQAAVVVLRPDTGEILAMASYPDGNGGNKENLCLKAEFPAASLFKIVAAAAAIEARDFTPDTRLAYRGRRYTLYRNQLKPSNERYSTKVSLGHAFSKSINPVFGKIGIYELGRNVLAEYANRFLFNLRIPFDLPLDESNFVVPDDDFGLAEIASGFNKKTLISPLHAALIAAAIANKGTVMEPWLIKRIQDSSEKVLYEVSPGRLSKVIEESTALSVKSMMEETVTIGTCRTAFRPLRRNKSFKNISLGAKTGTINDRSDRFKLDWLSAYAIPADGTGGICVAILAVHGKKLGIRAKDLGRKILSRYYFSS